VTPPPPRRRSGRRPALAALAIVGGLALVGVSAFQVLRGLALRRDAARRQLREHVGTATRAFSDAVIQAGSYVRPLIMAPVLGAVAREAAAPLRLADVARYAESELARLGFTGDSLRGYLRLPLVPAAGSGDSLYASAPGGTEVAGALATDSAFGAAALAAARELVDGVSPAATRFVSRNFHVRGHPVVITVAFELRPDLRPVAAFGCVYSRARFLSLIAKDVFGNIALLPPSFEGLDWSSAAPLHADGGGSRTPAREWTGTAARLNALLAVSVMTIPARRCSPRRGRGSPAPRAPTAPERSPTRSTSGCGGAATWCTRRWTKRTASGWCGRRCRWPPRGGCSPASSPSRRCSRPRRWGSCGASGSSRVRRPSSSPRCHTRCARPSRTWR
jgi:hypothetical protein